MRNTLLKATMVAVAAALIIAIIPPEVSKCLQSEGLTRWQIHDMSRPQPPAVTPGEARDKPDQPPSDAVVLFNGKDLSLWQGAKGEPAPWNGRQRLLRGRSEDGRYLHEANLRRLSSACGVGVAGVGRRHFRSRE